LGWKDEKKFCINIDFVRKGTGNYIPKWLSVRVRNKIYSIKICRGSKIKQAIYKT
jgi:hypothetical protein